MKTPITDIERRELEAKIIAGCPAGMPDGAFAHPLPEFAIGMQNKPGTIGVHEVVSSCPMQPWVEWIVSSESSSGSHVLGRFRLN
jgi:hypothetical protein